MRQNLTNVKEIDIKDVEHLYVVGSTMKEGLLEGKSNVKLDLKKAVSEGGGTSSEDAEKMYEAFFGQVPYFLAKNPDDNTTQMLPLYELFTALDEGLEISEYLYYKSDIPTARAAMVSVSDEELLVNMAFASGNTFMIEVLEEEGLPEGDTWYIAVGADVNLFGYDAPTANNPTVVSGKLPTDKNYIAVVESNDGTTVSYEYNGDIPGYIRFIGSGGMQYGLRQIDDNAIEWAFKATPLA